jgi:hypothetical protein
MKKVILLTEDEYNDLLLCVHHILIDAQNLPDVFSTTEIKRQAREIKDILENEE